MAPVQRIRAKAMLVCISGIKSTMDTTRHDMTTAEGCDAVRRSKVLDSGDVWRLMLYDVGVELSGEATSWLSGPYDGELLF
jgi:hypothetical protein